MVRVSIIKCVRTPINALSALARCKALSAKKGEVAFTPSQPHFLRWVQRKRADSIEGLYILSRAVITHRSSLV